MTWLSRPISNQDQKLATYAVIAKQERWFVRNAVWST